MEASYVSALKFVSQTDADGVTEQEKAEPLTEY